MQAIRYERVFDESITPAPYRDGFIAVYREVIKRHPVFKQTTDTLVLEKVWKPLIDTGLLILALEEMRVIGFGCAMRTRHSPAYIRQFVSTRGPLLPVGKTWFLSGTGVLSTYRRHGIGTALLRHRLLTISHNGGEHYVTKVVKGDHMSDTYRRLATTATQDPDNHTLTYFHGRCDVALRTLRPVAA